MRTTIPYPISPELNKKILEANIISERAILISFVIHIDIFEVN